MKLQDLTREMRERLVSLFSCSLPILKRIFTPLALGALIYFAWRSHDALSDIITAANKTWIFASIVIWSVLHLVSPLITTHILRSRRLTLNYTTALRIHAARLPAKYLPGGIWHSVARAGDYRTEGIATSAVGWYLLIENIIIAAVTLALGGGLVAIQSSLVPEWRIAGFISLIIGVTALAIVPVISRKSRWESIQLTVPEEYIKSVFYMIGYWSMVGLAFASYMRSFETLSLTGSSLEVAGIYIFSWAIGFITLIAPQGIGISEFVSSQLLEGTLPATGFMALIAGFRILILMADLLAWSCSLVLRAYQAD